MKAAALVLTCGLWLSACSGPDSTSPAPDPSPPPPASPPSAQPTPPAPQTPEPSPSEPLVFAVHVRRPPADLTRRQAGLLLDGGVRRWSQLGLPGGRLTVTRKVSALRSLGPDTVAI